MISIKLDRRRGKRTSEGDRSYFAVSFWYCVDPEESLQMTVFRHLTGEKNSDCIAESKLGELFHIAKLHNVELVFPAGVEF
tara:strand:+ start:122 stop:364 length:243 start_codon:yes stop_codon:yes gene_type:complete